MISTHILDTSLGSPAAGVTVRLEKQSAGQWKELAKEQTNQDGRISFSVPSESGTYRLHFDIEPYFRKNKLSAFFPEATVVFALADTKRKVHVPLLLSPYGYSTYRGS